jgi:hypothetical protein
MVPSPAATSGVLMPPPQRASCYQLTNVNDRAHANFWTADDFEQSELRGVQKMMGYRKLDL